MTRQMTIQQAWRKAEDYGVKVTYGTEREISCSFESWTISAIIREDADLPEAIAAIESRTWPEMCRSKSM